MLPFAEDCYAISAEELNFNEGRDFCDATFGSFFKNGKADLASVIHPYENEFIQEPLLESLSTKKRLSFAPKYLKFLYFSQRFASRSLLSDIKVAN